MLKRWARALITLVGMTLGGGFVAIILNFIRLSGRANPYAMPVYLILLIFLGAALIGGACCFLAANGIIAAMQRLVQKIERALAPVTLMGRILLACGVVLGLFAAYLVTSLFRVGLTAWLSVPISLLVYLLFGYLGFRIAWARRDETSIRSLFHSREGEEAVPQPEQKLLDTSVIIDGRIFDIAATGFVEGILIVPNFVVQELQHIADSADALKRNRGRRGLDILARMQKELSVPVRIVDTDYPDLAEVDQKLLRLAQETGAAILTNDYNLNKVADVHQVQVLNINELANAVKPVVLPGEEMTVQVVKEGKELGQGVAYLDDGTMVVVDGAKRLLGQTVEVVVTSVLQTAAGRMIFGRLKIAREGEA